jgi:hypothetical protein
LGTLLHECGHYVVAKYLGYSASINYGSTFWEDESTSAFTQSIYTKYAEEIEANQPFAGSDLFYPLQRKKSKDRFWIMLGGPMQTMLTGIFGLLLLLQSKKNIASKYLSWYNWLCIFLSLFWLRQLANCFTWFGNYLLYGKFLLQGDEIGLAVSLNLPKATFVLSSAIIATLVLGFIILKIIPSTQRFTFMIAGLFGGVFGYLFWLKWVGPILMP